MATTREYISSALAGLSKLAEKTDSQLEGHHEDIREIDEIVYDVLEIIEEYDGPKETPPTDIEGFKERHERLTKDPGK